MANNFVGMPGSMKRPTANSGTRDSLQYNMERAQGEHTLAHLAEIVASQCALFAFQQTQKTKDKNITGRIQEAEK